VIVVIAGPGGVGKGTIVERLIDRDRSLWLSRSWTTRSPRPGEAADAYTFVDRARFERHIDEGGFLEWAEFLDNLYGTPYPDSGADRDVVLEIDVQGMAQIRDREPDAVLIFLEAPSADVQRQRLEGRGDPAELIDQRLERAAEEAAAARSMGAHVVVNERVDDAVAHILAIIEATRARRSS
jgi:guanylate kinase